MTNSGKSFNKLVSVMQRLHGPKGCPWDRKQTHQSLLPYLFEEAKEVKQAIRKNDWKNLEEELGDILLQVIFHSQIAKESGRFDINDVIDVITKKLIRRHPHVFKGKKLNTPEEVVKQWKEIKKKEKQRSKIQQKKKPSRLRT